MSTTPPRTTRTILITLLIGFLSGATAATYVLLRYGYLIDFQLTSQTGRNSLHTPERIPQALTQTQQRASAGNQTPHTMPLTVAQTQEDVWIKEPSLQSMPQTETQTQQLAVALLNPTSMPPDQETQGPPGGIPHPQASSSVTDEGVSAEHGVIHAPGFESPTMMALAVKELRQRNLLLPLSGLKKEDLVDSFSEMRVNHVHEAIDILAPRNTPVLAVEDGSIARFWYSVPGGITIYQFDPEKKYEYYYAHLERYADGLKEGDDIKRGQVIGYVGTSGNAAQNTPHLHFTIFKLTESKHWWEGTPVNPYLVFR